MKLEGGGDKNERGEECIDDKLADPIEAGTMLAVSIVEGDVRLRTPAWVSRHIC